MKSMLKNKFYYCLLLACVLSLGAHTELSAQTAQSVVHVDKDFYVSGEIMWYTIHLPEFFKDNHRVVLVEIVNDRGDVVGEYKIKTEGKTSIKGYYKIPFDAETGVYRFFFHGLHRFIGQNVKLAEVEMPIYNDLERVNAQMTERNRSTESASFLTDLSVDISLAGDAVTNESNEVVITVRDANGNPISANLSVAVVDAQLCGRGVIVEGDPIDYRAVQALQDGMLVKGVLTRKEGDPLQVNVLGLYSPELRRVVYTKSDDYGRFFAKIPDFTGQRQYQFLGYTEEIDDFDVEVSRELSPGALAKTVEYTAEVLEYLELSRQRKQIYRYFTTLEHSITPQQIRDEPQELKPGVRYNIEEYEDFDDMQAFFGELITALKFEEKEEVYTATLDNPRGSTEAQTQLSGDPLFIVDGKATRDADYVARLDLSLVRYVDLYFNPSDLRKYFNVVGRNGVIVITTRIPDNPFPEEEQADIFTIAGLLPPADFPQTVVDGQPQISPQLYWNGDVKTNKDGISNVRFRQSDDLSSFRVVVVAQTPDGKRGMGILEYKLAQ